MASGLKNNAKYLFWGGCVAAAIAGGVCWFIGSGKLAKDTVTGESKIKSIKTSIISVTSVPSHPVDQTLADYNTSLGKTKERVRASALEIYKRQQALFVWPSVTPKFDQEIKGKTSQDSIADDARELYKTNFILKQVPRLCKIVDAPFEDVPLETEKGRPTPPPGFGPQGPGAKPAPDPARPAPLKEEHKVNWSDRKAIQNKFERDFRETPTTAQIWNAQEDLWIYEMLCKLIAEMNVNARGAHDATVWTIESMQLGQAASDAVGAGGAGKVELPAGASAAGATSDPAPGDGLVKKSGRTPTTTTTQGEDKSKTSTDDDLINNRYVHADGFPLTSTEVKNDTGAEFRRLPFRLRLGMDERKYETLLFKLRNAVLPIEVTSIRFAATAPAVDPDGRAARIVRQYSSTIEINGIIYLANDPNRNPALKVAQEAKPESTTEKPADAAADNATKPADAAAQPDTNAAEPKPAADNSAKPADAAPPANNGTAEPAPPDPAKPN